MNRPVRRRRSGRLLLLPLLAATALPFLGCSRKPATEAPAAPDTTRAWRERIAALESVRSFGDTTLFAATHHSDPRVRRAAAMALGRIQDARAAAPLLRLLEDPDTTVVTQTAWALRQIQGLDESERTRVELALVHALESQPNRRLWMFVEAVRSHASAACFPEVSKWVAAGLFAGMGSEAREPRLEGMAALTLASLDTPRAGALLGQLGTLQNRDTEAAWRIAEAMTIRVDSTYVASVLSLLGHHAPEARAAGARALAKYPRPESAPALFPLLADTDWRVRASALRALGELGDTQARSYCAAMGADTHPLVREAALAALEKLGTGDDTHLVEEVLHDPVPAVRLAALRALALSDAPAAAAAYAGARADSTEFVRAEALLVARDVLGDGPGAKELVQVLETASVRERAQAAQALGAYGSKLPAAAREPARTALEQALQGDDFVVAAQAADALGALELRDCTPALVAAYEKWQGHEGLDVRLAVLPALAAVAGKRAGAAARSCIEAAATDHEPRIAHAARTALARLDGAPEPPAPVAGADSIAPPPPAQAPIDLGAVRVRLVTSHGLVVLELDGDDYPRTVANFLRLIDSGFYANGVFHRVVPAFVVQGGCPRGDGWGDAGSSIPCEYGDQRYDRAGIVGMAHAGKDTGGSQFFITHLPVPRLDGRYTAFGRVVAGMDVVDRIVRGDRFHIERDSTTVIP